MNTYEPSNYWGTQCWPKTYLGIDSKNGEFKPPLGDVLRIQWGYTDNLRIWMNYGESPMNGGFSGKIKPNKNNGVSSMAMFDYIEGTHPVLLLV
jgi:hypothetical protein